MSTNFRLLTHLSLRKGRESPVYSTARVAHASLDVTKTEQSAHVSDGKTQINRDTRQQSALDLVQRKLLPDVSCFDFLFLETEVVDHREAKAQGGYGFAVRLYTSEKKL